MKKLRSNGKCVFLGPNEINSRGCLRLAFKILSRGEGARDLYRAVQFQSTNWPNYQFVRDKRGGATPEDSRGGRP